MPRPRQTLASSFAGMKSEYQGMTQNRFRRYRPGVSAMGGSADRHAYSEGKFLQMREYVRAMDRDDFLIGALTDRAVEQQVQEGFDLEVQTGDKEINQDIQQRWDEWAGDPQKCDTAGVHTFSEMERLTARSEMIDGDILGIPITDEGDSSHGTLQLLEADLCRTPSNSRKNVVHGVELDEKRRRRKYYFIKDQVDPTKPLRLVSDTYQIDAYDADGNPQVFQVFKPHRISLTRGVTAFKAVIDLSTMIEDTNFASVVKSQMAACAVWSWEKSDVYGANMPTGERDDIELADFTRATEEGVSPGAMFRPPKGMKLAVHGANIPGDQYFPLMKMLLTFVGMQIGMPLILVLQDASETNFSGWRGAVDMARMGFRCNQARRVGNFYTPCYRWKVRQWMDEDAALRAAAMRSDIKIFGHKFNTPRWPYIQPEVDTKADAFAINNYLDSPRGIAAKNSRDFDEVVDESIADNTAVIIKAIEASQEIFKKTGVQVNWRDVANRDLPRGGQVIDTLELENSVDGSPMPVSKSK